MGNNVAGALGSSYVPGNQLQFKNSYWQLFEASKKDDKLGTVDVTIFKFLKSQSDKIASAQRGVQKLRTMKHPFVLSFIDSSTTEDSIILVTEHTIPLSIWLNKAISLQARESPAEALSLLNQVLWGFRCIVQAIDFLHTKCMVGHNNISIDSIFVMKNGDWKLGFLDFAANPQSEKAFLRDVFHLIPKEVLPQEVSNNGFSESLSEVDIFSLGKCMEYVFDRVSSGDAKISDALRRSIQRMVSVEAKRRPDSSQILRYPDFNSESIKVLVDLGDFTLKSPAEVTETLRHVSSKARDFPSTICCYKIVPIVLDRLKIAITDFQNRELRENCRSMIDICVEIIGVFAELEKVTESTFPAIGIDIFSQIWTMPDRTIRNTLLRNCKNIIALFSAAVVNKNMFQPVLAGFSDSNPKMREETLKNLIYFVDKLDENNLQDRLVRQVKVLQDDTEKSIRTNAVIFSSKIAPKLKDVSRNKVLTHSFVKAMRDPFNPCRVAGLRASQACQMYMDPLSISTIVLPQVCTMLVDQSSDIRVLALAFFDSSSKILHTWHENLLQAQEKAATTMHDNSPMSTSTSSGAPPASSAWTSWAVGEITKTIEKVAVIETMGAQQSLGNEPKFAEINTKFKQSKPVVASEESTQFSAPKPKIGGIESSSYAKPVASTEPKVGASKLKVTADDFDNPDETFQKKNDAWDEDIHWSDDEDNSPKEDFHANAKINKSAGDSLSKLKLDRSDSETSTNGADSRGKSYFDDDDYGDNDSFSKPTTVLPVKASVPSTASTAPSVSSNGPSVSSSKFSSAPTAKLTLPAEPPPSLESFGFKTETKPSIGGLNIPPAVATPPAPPAPPAIKMTPNPASTASAPAASAQAPKTAVSSRYGISKNLTSMAPAGGDLSSRMKTTLSVTPGAAASKPAAPK